mgnify:CR=1 FL=1
MNSAVTVSAISSWRHSTEVTGDFTEAVRLSSEVLASKGHIYPATISDVGWRPNLKTATSCAAKLRFQPLARPFAASVWSLNGVCRFPEALKAIRAADVIYGRAWFSLHQYSAQPAGSRELPAAIGESQATKIFICNLMTQPGETDNYTARQHLETTKSYAPEIHFDFVIVNDRRITKEQAQRYAQEGAHQIGIDDDAIDAVLDESTASHSH